MTKQIIRTILAGVLAGFALFIMPFFLLRFLTFFLLVGAAVRLLRGRRRGFGRHRQYAFEKFNSMTDEEKAAFRANMRGRCGRYGDAVKTEQ